ncbi:Crp/Fnr family transcriptional regulator [Desulfobotulus mexicanus]|uniref:Cyclic nucleotide-binding domain-containing protein n=1 Tax=Desulfobotulus mexicanus TaxID=2586642 RepID=A0A5Q4VDW3_9BACT|nr:cyclic nucleotide-binding domain-containing protein [Desulfobotulus mexicanus]TYT75153.1 cyclic nucleotide-binding domain-containing protein [Desulfobotulus mexicanus]
MLALSDTMVRILKTLPLLKRVSPESIEILAAYMQIFRVREGEEIIRWGRRAETLYITISGDYMMAFPDGSAFTLHGSGEVIGMNAMLNQGRYTAKALALTDGSLMALYRSGRDRMLEDHPRFADRIHRSIQAYLNQRQAQKNSGEIFVDEDFSRGGKNA